MDALKKIRETGIVPVVVIDDVKNAVPAARALAAGGVGVMEITFRTAAGPDAIGAVAKNCPDVLVGAGTVVNLEQCKRAIGLGAQFIVSPGFDREIVKYCVEQGIPVTPGCVTPTEIMAASEFDLNVLKYFTANIYGGLAAMKALSGPFGQIRFIPTGGVSAQNLAEFIAAPFVHAVGGSWICDKADIAAGNFEKITRLCQEARRILLGFEMVHVGINCAGPEESLQVCGEFADAFDFETKEGASSNFASGAIEVMKSNYLGDRGHLAVRTNSLDCAVAALARKGYRVDPDTAKFKGDKMTAVYLEKEFGGFAVHLLQR